MTVRVSPDRAQSVSRARFAAAVRRASAQACSAPRAASAAPDSAARSAAVAARWRSIRTLAAVTAAQAQNQTRAHRTSTQTVPEPRSTAGR
ncbi:hypothetical protein AC529_11925 [Thermobifida cellulosilytica TB100]|uniref:Uncharacterized protein n=1 Tax=Thermobifida cellulosilytica TB100 TaxID=665004 RepID=A0A147KGN1_THECS|nr:hypothetical protein AC529_11925 [Thermobifida cellulosilytica TB100]